MHLNFSLCHGQHTLLTLAVVQGAASNSTGQKNCVIHVGAMDCAVLVQILTYIGTSTREELKDMKSYLSSLQSGKQIKTAQVNIEVHLYGV